MTAEAFAFDAAPSIEELARFDLNDDGNAMRLIRMTGGRIGDDGVVDVSTSRVLYLRRRGWIVFNGQFWDLETGEARARRHAVQVARSMHAQMEIRVAALADKLSAKAIQAIHDFGTSTGNSARLSSMLKVAAAYLDVDMDAFDRDPLALNCRNGVLRFRHGPDGPVAAFTDGHEPGDRFTRMVDASYDPVATAALFRQVLETSLPNREDRHYLHKALGYCATGSTAEQKFFVFQGKGGDGKSTVVNAVRSALGTYATVVGIETFLDTGTKRGSDASPDIAALAGDTRMLCAGEPPGGSKLATGAIKQFTGGGKMKARELREGLFEFSPLGKPIIECNRRPQINDTDNGIWRRLKIIPFMVQIPEDRIDGHLPKKLERELDGILAWIVEGVLAWMDEGLGDIESVRESLEDYRKGSNPFTQWLEDRVVMDREARVRASLLYRDYKDWMEAQGHDRPMSQKAFGMTLGDLQIVLGPKDGAGLVTRRGARLKGAFEPPPGPAHRSRGVDPPLGVGGLEGEDPFLDDGTRWPQ
ncbi:DNA primase family protein [Caulobacter sp. ErkDOM-YI]|uniref:DNA primase family protein n=1 Tax=unclassified Caulobacter TaxID=2648921 RepID=UPI003AF52569